MRIKAILMILLIVLVIFAGVSTANLMWGSPKRFAFEAEALGFNPESQPGVAEVSFRFANTQTDLVADMDLDVDILIDLEGVYHRLGADVTAQLQIAGEAVSIAAQDGILRYRQALSGGTPQGLSCTLLISYNPNAEPLTFDDFSIAISAKPA